MVFDVNMFVALVCCNVTTSSNRCLIVHEDIDRGRSARIANVGQQSGETHSLLRGTKSCYVLGLASGGGENTLPFRPPGNRTAMQSQDKSAGGFAGDRAVGPIGV